MCKHSLFSGCMHCIEEIRSGYFPVLIISLSANSQRLAKSGYLLQRKVYNLMFTTAGSSLIIAVVSVLLLCSKYLSLNKSDMLRSARFAYKAPNAASIVPTNMYLLPIKQRFIDSLPSWLNKLITFKSLPFIHRHVKRLCRINL